MLRSDGTLLLEFKKSWRDGTRAVLTPRDLLVRLCAAIPLPFVNQVRYFGVLASAAAVRDEVVPLSEPLVGAFKPPPAAGDQLELLGEMSDQLCVSQRRTWARVLAHTFGVGLKLWKNAAGPCSLFAEDVWTGLRSFGFRCSVRTWAYTLATTPPRDCSRLRSGDRSGDRSATW